MFMFLLESGLIFALYYSDDCDAQNRLYGDIWLLEQIAEKTKIRRDLEVVFDGNKEMVDAIMALAMFPYLTN